jgi:hypothetical protein
VVEAFIHYIQNNETEGESRDLNLGF